MGETSRVLPLDSCSSFSVAVAVKSTRGSSRSRIFPQQRTFIDNKWRIKLWRRLAQLVSPAQGQVLAAVATWTLVRGTGLPHPAPSPPETYSGETISKADGPPHMLWARCERTRRTASPCPMGLCSKWISGDQEKKSGYSPRPRPPLRATLSI